MCLNKLESTAICAKKLCEQKKKKRGRTRSRFSAIFTFGKLRAPYRDREYGDYKPIFVFFFGLLLLVWRH